VASMPSSDHLDEDHVRDNKHLSLGRHNTEQHPLTSGDSTLRCFFAAYYREAS